MAIHIIKQGEHISRLAEQYGLGLFETIWNCPENAALKKKRENPNVLLPGDQVFIPDRQAKEVNGATELRHSYKLKGKPLKLRLIVQDATGKPLPDTKATLQIDGRLLTVKSDAQGLIEQPIPHTAENAVLIFEDPDTYSSEPVEIRIGHLDPIDTPSGWIARLDNLGYNAGSKDPVPEEASADQASEREQRLRSAIEEFQCDHGLVVDGACGPKTQKMLKDVHGC